MSEIVGCELDLAELWGRTADDLSSMLNEAATVAERAVVLERALLDALPSVAPPPLDAAAIFRVMQTGSDLIGGKISALLDRLDVSERTLRRRSHDHFGYGPKTLDRILRFQNLLALAREQRDGLAALAIDAGYADQAHLSREVQALCGMTARDLVRQVARRRDAA
jgi:AraC-like DNA-binding protein